MKQWLISFTAIILCICGCSRSGSSLPEQVYYDAEESAYYIPAQNLVYRLPNSRFLVVADPQNLPEQMNMCIVDTSAMISVLLLNIPEFPRNQKDAERVVNLISAQENAEYSAEQELRCSCDTFLNVPAWNFDVMLRLKNEADTISVIYYGLIFENLALVTTAQADTIPYNLLNEYIVGLQRVVD